MSIIQDLIDDLKTLNTLESKPTKINVTLVSNVGFKDKDTAKENGYIWDSKIKQWIYKMCCNYPIDINEIFQNESIQMYLVKDILCDSVTDNEKYELIKAINGKYIKNKGSDRILSNCTSDDLLFLCDDVTVLSIMYGYFNFSLLWRIYDVDSFSKSEGKKYTREKINVNNLSNELKVLVLYECNKNIKISNLPINLKKIYLYNCECDNIKVPFGCEIIRIQKLKEITEIQEYKKYQIYQIEK